MKPVHRLRKGIATWRVTTFFDQQALKSGYPVGGLPLAIMDNCQDRVPQRSSILRRPAAARPCFVILRRPIPLGTFVFVPIGEIRSPHNKLAVPETEHQDIIVPAVTNSSATYVRRMIRQPTSDWQYLLQKLRGNPPRFNGRSPLHPCGRAGAEVDRKRPLQCVSAQEGCGVFLPRSEANGKVALNLLDRSDGLRSRRIAPHALNGLIHAFGNEQKFG